MWLASSDSDESRWNLLDPTCGSGVFLFAALNILKKLYETCLIQMQAFVSDLVSSGEKHSPKKLEHFRLKLLEMNDKSKAPRPSVVRPPPDVAVDPKVDVGTTGGAYLLQARLNVSLPGIHVSPSGGGYFFDKSTR
jgi:hypothetical protein